MSTETRSTAAIARALAVQVKPTFAAPAVATSVFGGLLAPTVEAGVLAIHALGVGVAIYVAHLVDEFVDTHLRDEEPPTLSRRTLGTAAGVASGIELLVVATLWLFAGPLAAASLVVLWLLAVLHAPVLDRNPVTVTLDYPVGIAVALLGGHLTQGATPGPPVSVAAGVFLLVLAGAKVLVDRLDADFDRRIDKRTVPVVAGDRGAIAVASLAFVGTGALLVAAAVGNVLPRFAAVGAAFPLAMALVTAVGDPRTAVRAAIVLSYPLAAVLFVACCTATGCAVLPVVETAVGAAVGAA